MFNTTTRRTFLKQTGVLSVSSILPLSVLPLDPRFKMGLQLFTIRDAELNQRNLKRT